MYRRIENESCLLAGKIFKNIELHKHKDGLYQSYTYNWNKKPELNKNLLTSHHKFEDIVYSALSAIFFNDEEEIKRDRFTCLKIAEAEATKIFEDLFYFSDNESFKLIIKCFEKLVNTKITGDTDFYRSFILHILAKKNLKENNEKIKQVLSSEILNRKDNACDVITNKSRGSFKFEECDFYRYYIPTSLIIMTELSKDKNKTETILPDFKVKNINAEIVFYHLDKKYIDKIDLLKIDKDLLLNKFGLKFLKDFQKNYGKSKIKDDIHFIIKDKVSVEDKKEMLLETLIDLNIKNFNYISKKYPDVLINIDLNDIENYDFKGFAPIIKSKKPSDLAKLFEKYGINKIDSRPTSIFNNMWSVICVEKSILEKKEIEKKMKKKESLLPKRRKRI